MGQLCKIPFLAWINSAEIVLWTWKIHICTHTQDQPSSLCNLFLSPTFGGFQLHLAMHMLYEHTNILTSSLDNLKKSKKYPHLFKLLGKQISKKKKAHNSGTRNLHQHARFWKIFTCFPHRVWRMKLIIFLSASGINKDQQEIKSSKNMSNVCLGSIDTFQTVKEFNSQIFS